MKEHPFLAMDRVASAVRDGRQTQDRRPIDWLRRVGRVIEFRKTATRGYDWCARSRKTGGWYDLKHDDMLSRLPWQPGDALYVREAWQVCDLITYRIGPSDAGDPLGYIPKEPPLAGTYTLIYRADWAEEGSWRPNIHMPKWAARTRLLIARMWVERIQDITEEGAGAEGCASIAEFRELWDSLYGKRVAYPGHKEPGYLLSWDANPWVRCCEFKVEDVR